MLSPEEMTKFSNSLYDMDKIITEVDEAMKKFHNWFPWESAVLYNELPIEIRNEIAMKYIIAGWKYVYHITTSENDEKPGLTSFHFSQKPIETDNKCFLVMKSEMNSSEFVVYRNDILINTIELKE